MSKEIDMEQLAALMRMKPTQKDCAAFFKCSEDTIERRIKAYAGVTFAEFRDQNMVHTRFDLIRTAIQKAKGGDNVMLIFCLKNLCGWRDRYQEDDAAGSSHESKPTLMTNEQMVALVRSSMKAA